MSETRQLLRLATAGSVDDGKSTLIGRILHDTGSLPVDQLASVTDETGVVDLGALADGLRAEREQGITIDVAYRFFSTPTRSFILADTPGHEQYTRNMFTGASNADVAVLLVDARHGPLLQTRRHARIATLLGVPHLVAAVNKIDLVDFDADRFHEVAAELRLIAERLGAPPVQVIPLSAKAGDNVVHASPRTPWYTGPTLLEFLESIELTPPAHEPNALRLPIQWSSRPTAQQRRRYTGRLSAGRLAVGDEVIVLPEVRHSVVTALDTLDPARSVAVPGLSVAVELADNVDVARGDVLVSASAPPEDLPTVARELYATVCWMSSAPVRAGDRFLLKQGTRTVRATIQELHTRLEPNTLQDLDQPPELVLNDIGAVTLRTRTPLVADAYAHHRENGSFVLIDERSNDTVGAGVILEARAIAPDAPRRRDVVWHPSALRRERRIELTGLRGATVWLTGLPASGKSTLAVALERALVEAGRPAYLLDGDNVRHGLSDDLAFTPADRAEHNRRVGHLTRLFADAGVVSIASLVSPLRSDRAVPHDLHQAAGLPFIEIHVATPVEECARRDPKGLYARAAAGTLRGLTGVDAPYEPPENPSLTLDTTGADTDELVARIVEVLDRALDPAS